MPLLVPGLQAAFDGLGLRRVTAKANLDSVASVRVLEHAGMRRERHAVKALWNRELGWLDELEYAMLDDEWVARACRFTHRHPEEAAVRAVRARLVRLRRPACQYGK